MVKRYDIAFHETPTPISGLVTKFGGQPTWATKPEWPISASTGEPMRFIGQVALDEVIFSELAGRMAYLFMNDFGEYGAETWDPESGENALIVQPGRYEQPSLPLSTGPSLETWATHPGLPLRTPHPVEYAVELRPSEDPDAFGDFGESDEPNGRNKIGGTPAFLQAPHYPSGGPWKLVLQLDSVDVPFDVNFGDAGIGYAFISADGETGKFLWQCL